MLHKNPFVSKDAGIIEHKTLLAIGPSSCSYGISPVNKEAVNDTKIIFFFNQNSTKELREQLYQGPSEPFPGAECVSPFVPTAFKS